jgi:hypothetical protein
MDKSLLIRMLLLSAMACAPTRTIAQSTMAWLPAQGHGSVSVAYQYLFIKYHTDSRGNKALPGTIDNRGLYLEFDYGLTDRLALTIDLPYKSNRYNERIPGSAHDPRKLEDDNGENFIDDGLYHSGFGDWNLGLRYRWRSEPWAITPYLSFGVPSRDYTTFAHSAVGTGQKRLELGVNAGRQFTEPLQKFYFQGSYGYSIMEEVDHRRVNHSTLTLELGYQVTPRLTTRLILVGRKTHNGEEFPEDYPLPRDDDHFFHHDENVRNDFINAAVGIDYQLNDRYALYGNYARSLWGENAHLVDHSITVGISRGF